MKLKAYVKSMDEVPEHLRELYEESSEGEGYVLSVDEKDFKKELDEFRRNNRKLYRDVQELQEILKKKSDVDPEELEELRKYQKQLQELEEKGLLKEGKIEEVLAKRTEAMRQDFEKQIRAKSEALKAAEEALSSTKAKLSELVIDSAVRNSVEKVGKVRQGAMDDIMHRARACWRVNDQGELEAPDQFDEKGNPMSMEAWAKGLLDRAPHLFEGGGGSGAQGGKGAGTGGVKVIPASDKKAFSENLAAIAAGKVRVAKE